MRLERKFSKLLRIAISCSFLFAFFIYKPVQAQCGSTGGGGTPSCPGTIYRPGAYDDYGTDDPSIYDGSDPTTSAAGVLESNYPYNYDATINAAMDYEYAGGGYYDVYPLIGQIIYSNFGSTTSSYATTLHLPYSVSVSGGSVGATGTPYVTVTATVGGVTTTIYNGTEVSGHSGEWTLSVPSGTDLSQVQVSIRMEPWPVYDNYDTQYESTAELTVDVYIE